METRKMLSEDVPAACDVVEKALPPPDDFDAVEVRPWLERRTRHMLASDPAGAWVSEQDGRITGMALAIVRDGIWGLSLLAVDPELHARGAGQALLRAALMHAEGTRGQLIMSSTDPRAMRIYARAGFDLHPTISLSGMLDRSAIPGGLRSVEATDLEEAAAIGRTVRGGAYGPGDLALLCTRPGSHALTIPGRGFAIHNDGSLRVLAADSCGVALDLLWSCLATAKPAETVTIEPLMAGQDWAVQAGLTAGLAITPGGPMYTRGELGPLRPWIPSGALL